MYIGELSAFRLALFDKRRSHRKLWVSESNLPAGPQVQEQGASEGGEMSSHWRSSESSYSAMSPRSSNTHVALSSWSRSGHPTFATTEVAQPFLPLNATWLHLFFPWRTWSASRRPPKAVWQQPHTPGDHNWASTCKTEKYQGLSSPCSAFAFSGFKEALIPLLPVLSQGGFGCGWAARTLWPSDSRLEPNENNNNKKGS